VAEQSAVVLDRFPLWLEAVEAVVAACGFHAVESTRGPDEALGLLHALRPELHVVGLDTFGVRDEGLAYLSKVSGLAPQANIVVLSPDTDPASIDAALEAGAFAYVFKTAEADDLAAAIRQAFEYTMHFPGSQENALAASADAVPAGRPPAALTQREREILGLVAEGVSNAQLAQRLLVSEKTVRFHLSNVYKKLDVSNRTEASRWAQKHGLVQLVA